MGFYGRFWGCLGSLAHYSESQLGKIFPLIGQITGFSSLHRIGSVLYLVLDMGGSVFSTSVDNLCGKVGELGLLVNFHSTT